MQIIYNEFCKRISQCSVQKSNDVLYKWIGYPLLYTSFVVFFMFRVATSLLIESVLFGILTIPNIFLYCVPIPFYMKLPLCYILFHFNVSWGGIMFEALIDLCEWNAKMTAYDNDILQ